MFSAYTIKFRGTPRLLLWLLLFFCPIGYSLSQTIHYVDLAANGAGDGLSWKDAYTDLAFALENANSGDEVWVAKGVYSPGVLTGSTFSLKSGVKLLGGFSGTESSIQERVHNGNNLYSANETILTGSQINLHVISIAPSATAETLIDGFTIREGSAGMATTANANNYGGGIYHVSGSARLQNLKVENNRGGRGGGMYAAGTPTLENILFSQNEANLGGGLHVVGAARISNLTFSKNKALNQGGGLYNTSSPTLENLTFIENESQNAGGGFYNTGTITLYNSVFSRNRVLGNLTGGGMFATGTANLVNVTFSQNTTAYAHASNPGGGGLSGNSNTRVSNSIFWGNSSANALGNQLAGDVAVERSIVQGGFEGGEGIITVDPLFLQPSADDLRTAGNSIAIDAGINNRNTTISDLAGNPRIINGTIDLGAYEATAFTGLVINNHTLPKVTRKQSYKSTLTATGGNGAYTWSVAGNGLPHGLHLNAATGEIEGVTLAKSGTYPVVIEVTDGELVGSKKYFINVGASPVRMYVNAAATSGANTGSSWADGFVKLQAALNSAEDGDEIWVAGGVYSPGNLPADAFRLVSGVQVFGGFAGTESHIHQRLTDEGNFMTAHPSILEGGGINYHVISNEIPLSNTTILDGFTIRGGKAAAPEPDGGGIYNGVITVGAVFRNLIIQDNQAIGMGGGIFNTGVSTFDNILLKNNLAGTNGGGIYTNRAGAQYNFIQILGNKANNGGGVFNTANINFFNGRIEDNESTLAGGGLHNSGAATFVDLTVKGNQAGSTGGGIHNTSSATFNQLNLTQNTSGQHGGGMYNSGSTATSNAVFSGNVVLSTGNHYGGGLYNTSSNHTLRNVTFSNNRISRSSAGGGGLYRNGGTVNVSNSIFWGNSRGGGVADQISGTTTVTYSIVEGGYAGTGNLSVNPIFVDAQGHDLRLQAGSPGINSGLNSNVSTPLDLDGKTRIKDNVVDMGAYEFGEASMAIAPATLRGATRGSTFSYQFATVGGEAGLAWSLASGSLPMGLGLSEQGLLQGIPIGPVAAYTFELEVTDGTSIGRRTFTLSTQAGKARIYVKEKASGRQTGGSWADGLTSLSQAIEQALVGDEVWVGQGRYSPGTGTADAFRLKDGVKIYGGFAGTEAELHERVADSEGLYCVHESILDGGGNNYHVVFNDENVGNQTELNGFTVTGGKTMAGTTSNNNFYGGGIFNSTGSAVFSHLWIKGNIAARGGGMYNTGNITLRYVVFQENSTTNTHGGGLWNTGNATLQSVRFLNNISGTFAGGMLTSAATVLKDVTFSGNQSGTYGGGLVATGAVDLQDVMFIQNLAGTTGGGMDNRGAGTVLDRVAFIDNRGGQHGGGLFNNSVIQLENVVFSRNEVTSTAAHYGGGMYNSGTANLTNTTFSNNRVARNGVGSGGGYYSTNNNAAVFNSIFWGNTSGGSVVDQINEGLEVGHSIVEGGYQGVRILIADPVFENAVNDDFRLKAGSLAIDAGDNRMVSTDLDFLGNRRIVGTVVDMGAYENPGGGNSLVVGPEKLHQQQRGQAVSLFFDTNGSENNFTFEVSSGELPLGLTFDGERGLLSGTPTVAGTYTIVISATDGELIGSRQYTWEVTAGPSRFYVDHLATGNGLGISWENALTDLQEALAQALEGDEIWVAKGTYSPGSGTGDSFVLKEGVKLFGGFAGTENELSERAVAENGLFSVNETILDGKEVNYHVIFNNSVLSSNTEVNGFTISGGKTLSGSTGVDYYGGGIYNTVGGPTFSHLWIKNNEAARGGGMYNSGPSSIIQVVFERNKSTSSYAGGLWNTGPAQLWQVVFLQNESSLTAGGMYNAGAVSLCEVEFRENSSQSNGGGMWNNNSPTMDRVAFINNSSNGHGGGLYSTGTVIISNSFFSRNKVTNTGALYGGGMWFNSGTATLVNVTFSENSVARTAAESGGGLYMSGGTMEITNSIFWGNKRGAGEKDQIRGVPIVSFSIVEDGFDGSNNLVADPLFEDAASDNLQLRLGSLAIDMGYNEVVNKELDYLGNPRIVNDIVDLGAFEKQGGASLDIGPEQLPNMVRGEQIDIPLVVGDGTGAMEWSILSGDLPTGLRLGNNGAIKGRPMVEGSYTFVVMATDGTQIGSRQYTVDIQNGPTQLLVWASAEGDNSGSDWQNAITDLQSALGQASSGDEIWVGEGNYSPGAGVLDNFALKEGVKLYGGFAGMEESLEQRVADEAGLFTSHPSVLDGKSVNRHVVYNDGSLSNATVLDGFIITGGKTLTRNNTTSLSFHYYGGGIYNAGGEVVFSNLLIKENQGMYGGGIYNTGHITLSNVHLVNNQATGTIGKGAGLFNTGSINMFRGAVEGNSMVESSTGLLGAGIYNSGQLNVTESYVQHNNVGIGNGGGLYNTGAGSSLNIQQSWFEHNLAGLGGGLFINSGNHQVADVVFAQNKATSNGGGAYTRGTTLMDRVSFIDNEGGTNGGGLHHNSGSLTIQNTVFSRNRVSLNTSSGQGGGLYHHGGTSQVVNVTFSANQTALTHASTNTGAGLFFRNSGSMEIHNSIFWGNRRGGGQSDQLVGNVTITHSLVQNGFGEDDTILQADPLFEDALNDNLRLRNNSPAIDIGDNDKQVGQLDRDGNQRIANGIVDLGAYENLSGVEVIVIEPELLDNISRGSPVNLNFNATGFTEGDGGAVWELQQGALPTGLRLSREGVLSGRPTVTGIYTFVVTVSSGESFGSRQYTVEVLPSSTRLMVWAQAGGDRSGSDFANGINDLQEALNQAVTGDTILVAKGVYSPGDLVTSTFTLKENVKLFGGFSGAEEHFEDREEENLLHNETILDGSKGVASRHVVTNLLPLTSATILDGFTITGGLASVGTNSGASYRGAGIYNVAGAPVFSNLVIRNNIGGRGAGIWNAGNATFSKILLQDNTATYAGGLWSENGSPVLTDIVFKDNTGTNFAGGMHLASGSAVLERVAFVGNKSLNHGGGLRMAGGNLQLENVVFSRNQVSSTSSNYGGGMYVGAGVAMISNATFSNNSVARTAAGSGGGLFATASGNVNVANSIFWGNVRGGNAPDQLNEGITVSYSIVQGGYATGSEVLQGDPGFLSPDQDLLSLRGGSPAIDVGDNSRVSSNEDILGNLRIFNDVVDLGAYENQGSASLNINMDEIGPFMRGERVSLPLTADGGNGQYSWSLQVGNLPIGVDLTPEGMLTSTPMVEGTYTFVLAVTDGEIYGSKQFTVEIVSGNAIIHVAQHATGTNNGSKWQDALVNLQEAFTQAVPGDEIWVSKGSYSPGTTATSYFTLLEGVKIYGGFAGTEESLEDRDLSLVHTVNETILDGSQGTASRHVVYNIAPLTEESILDGFTVSGGRTLTNGTGASYYGGGIYNTQGSPIFRNLIVSNNTGAYGGGMFNSGSPLLSHVIFKNNIAAGSNARGAGLYSNAPIQLHQVTFESNVIASSGTSSRFGGGMFTAAYAQLDSVYFLNNKVEGSSALGGGLYSTSGAEINLTVGSFKGNSSTSGGGAMYINSGSVALTDVNFTANNSLTAGAIFQNGGNLSGNRLAFIHNIAVQHGGAIRSRGEIRLDNSIFSRNQVSSTGAYYGGGAYVAGGTATFSNVTLSNNSIGRTASTPVGGAIYRASGAVNIYNSILWGNKRGGGAEDQLGGTASFFDLSHSVIQGGFETGHNLIFGDPLFEGAGVDDLRLRNGSLAIDQGNNEFQLFDLDLAGNERVINDVIDIGAYENDGGEKLNILPESIETLLRGNSPAIQFITEGEDGEVTFALEAGELPVGLSLTPAGLLEGVPTILGIYEFVVSARNGDMAGNRQFRVEVLPSPAILFVDVAATGNNDGNDWTNALNSLQEAFDQAFAGDEIWVAKGNYSPGTAATSYFTLKEGVKVYGGFAGTEISLDDREIEQIHTANQTILDGSQGTASRHVVYNIADLSQETVLDGFTIRGGRTLTGSTGANYYGGGIYNRAGSPLLRNLLITENTGAYGGGMFNSGNPTLEHVIFRGNTSTGTNARGAGLYSNGQVELKGVVFEANTIPASSSRVLYGAGMFNGGAATLDSVFFVNNTIGGTAGQGGGLYNTSSAELIVKKGEYIGNTAASGGAMYINSGRVELWDILVRDNEASLTAGGIFQNNGSLLINRSGFINNSALQHGGAIRSRGTLEVSNSIFSRNRVNGTGSFYGGAIYVASGAATLSNTSLSLNKVSRIAASVPSGGAVYRAGGNVAIQNSILWGNSRGGEVPDQVGGVINNIQISHSILEGGFEAGNFILDINPLFMDAAGDDLRISGCSPGIDTGNNGQTGSGGFDYLGNPRTVNHTVDLGAYEYQEDGQLLSITSDDLPVGNRGSYYEYQLAVQDGTGQERWQVLSGHLPDGLALSSEGIISGNPIVNGVFEFVVNVGRGELCGNKSFAIEIIPSEGVVQIFVSQAAENGQNNGSNWENAYLSLQRALEVSVAGDEIWVAKGSYSPGLTVRDFFHLKEGVRMFGGFAGTEADLDQRDTSLLHTANRTILDGSMEGAAAYHVLYNVDALTPATIVDGFVISGGRGVTSNSINGKGVGFYNSNGSPLLTNLVFENNTGFQGAGMYTLGANARPELRSVVFKQNTSRSHGGGLYIASGVPVLEDVVFEDNLAEGSSYGGALYNGANTAFTLSQGRFLQNEAGRGGAIYLATGAPVIKDVIFERNHAGVYAGALFAMGRPVLQEVKFLGNTSNRHAGALWSSGTVSVQNGLFAQNKVLETGAYYGGAIYSNSGTLTLVNSTLADNRIAHVNAHATAYYGGAVFRRSGTVNIFNSIIWGNERGNGVADQFNANISQIGHTLIEGGFERGTTIVSSDPMFRKEYKYDYSLQACSPAINMGENTFSNGISVDLEGKGRVYGSAVDLGVYESHQEQLTLTPAVLPDATRGAFFEIQLSIEGGEGRNFEVFYNQLPDGLSLSPEGKLEGRTLAVGEFTFGIKASDGEICGNRLFTMNVLPGEGGARIYVNQSAPISGQNNGADWQNAYLDLQSALQVAMAGDSIWVAKGTYSPGERVTSYFVPVEGVKMFGGFSGLEDQFDERDSAAIHGVNATILDGSQGSASRHVLYNTNALTPETIVDGFVISGGKTSNTNSINGRGAGFYNSNGSPVLSNLIFRNNEGYQGGGMYTLGAQARPLLDKVKFEGNTSRQHGGGLHVASGQPELNEVEFINNRVTLSYNGGGLYSNTTLPMALTKLSFIDNEANRGGGFYNAKGSPVMEEIVFERNHARLNAGGMYALGNPSFNRAKFIGNTSVRHAGGLWSSGNIAMENAVFSRNRVTTTGNFFGGGIYHINGTLQLRQATFSQNNIARATSGGGGAIYRAGGNVQIFNSILWNNTHGNGLADQVGGTAANIKIAHSIVENGYPTGTNILDLDPEFVDPTQDDLSLSACSPAINMGDNSQVKFSKDLDGMDRIMHQLVDLGAYEFQGTFLDTEPLVLPEGTQWEAYTFQLELGKADVNTFSLGFGLLPDGLVLSEDGMLSGEPTVYGEFEFNVNIKGSDICGLLHVKLSIKPEDPYIVEVLNPFPEPISRYLGTAFEDLDLPDSVEVILSDKSRTYFPVDWQAGSYNPNEIGLYKLIGIINASEQVNRDNLFPEIKVAVVEPLIPYIAAVAELAPISILSGTTFDELAGYLPQRVGVTIKIDTDEAETIIFEDELEVVWKPGNYLPQFGTYRIFGEFILDSHLTAFEFPLTNPAEFEAMLDIYAQRNIVKSEVLADVIVDLHTPSSGLELRQPVRVTYHDGSTGLLEVLWDLNDFDGSLGGDFEIWGDFVLSPLISNSEAIQAFTRVIIQKEIISVDPDPAAEIQVPFGTSFDDIMDLPEEVMVHFNDGSSEMLAVNWLAGDYDELISGEYLVLGELLHGDLIVPTEEIFAKAIITLLPEPKNIIEIFPLDSIYVHYGTALSAIDQLEEPVLVKYDDQSTGSLPVLWETSAYDPYQVGSVEVFGELLLPDDMTIVNELGLEPSFILTVRLKQITAFAPPDTVKVDFGTDLLDLELPEVLLVTYIDGSHGEEAIEWESQTYDGQQEGIYPFAGNWILEDETGVDEELESPMLWVSVGSKPLEVVAADSSFVAVDIFTSFEAAKEVFPTEVVVELDNGSTDQLEVIWQEGGFQSEEPGLQYVYGELILNEGVVNPADVLAVMVVEIGKHKVVDLESLEALEVPFGEAFEDLPLPTYINALLTSGENVSLEVIWVHGDYNGQQAGHYILTGQLLLLEEIENPLGLEATIEIIVLDRIFEIISVQEFEILQVPIQTSMEEIAGLPHMVTVLLDNGSERELPVTQWISDSFEPNLPGIYRAYGTLELSIDIVNPNDIYPVLDIQVLELYLTELRALDTLYIPYGTAWEDITFPLELTGVYNDSSTGEVSVEWLPNEEFDSQIPGEYIFLGELMVSGENENPNNLQAEIIVIVEDEPLKIIAIQDLPLLQVPFGTPQASVLDTLPNQVLVYLSNDTETYVDVIWEAVFYDGESIGQYTFMGSLEFGEGLNYKNPDELEALQLVEVNAIRVEKVGELLPLIRPAGKPLSDLDLPETVEVELSDGQSADLDVFWNSENYDSLFHGLQPLVGELLLSENLSNPDDLKAQVDLILWKDMVQVAYMDTLHAYHGSAFGELMLPESILVDFTDGSSMQLFINWEEAKDVLESAGPGLVLLQGILELGDEQLFNSNDLTADVWVELINSLVEVSFDTDGGSSIPSQLVNLKALANRPPDPIKEGLAFEGWYEDPERTVYFDFSLPIEKGMTLYGQWMLPPLPSDGSLSMQTIASYMVLIGELAPDILEESFSLAHLNAFSHLSKQAPFRISDWYGYRELQVPKVKTMLITHNQHEVMIRGTILDTGGGAITEAGVCWSKDPLPSMSNVKIVGSESSEFEVELPALEAGTTYYIRTYAQSEMGIGYGNTIILKIE
ncbi:Ig-like domain-containing protein [Litoribacter alkaliphilus]|uniref:Ig-like domain-containing protein n=1 Tax=Litoribacter ruber TaxID=702568 RepID=A0AAP2CLG1_9BACT|nr:choice-of-anchor Q domain-containing protein [Litoribacter alkaliphilus]MBS9525899.1 Ig-like domain-containing protein [Litoribacter alkaliphilus]